MIAIVFLLVLKFIFSACPEINESRADYNSIDSESKLEYFIKKYESSKCSELKPFLAAATMMKAQYAISPIKKLKYFNNGKDKLEAYIKKNTNSVDARYLRIMIQGTIPKFLNYSSDLKNDIKFVRENINKTDMSPEIKTNVLKNIANIKQ